MIDLDNLLCRYPAEIIAKHHPEVKLPFIVVAAGRRRLVGWVESECRGMTGDEFFVWIPPQRIYAHT